MILNNIFYTIKPLIPRHLQIFLRRQVVLYKRKKYRHIWPIDPKAGKPPEGWQGWPDNKKFALVLSHDVDTQNGHDKCYLLMEIEERLGFRSSLNFVPERYEVSKKLLKDISDRGLQVCVHGLKHDGKLFSSRKIFERRAIRINQYIREWGVEGFTTPSMLRNPEWIYELNVSHCTSTFDTDPFEPQPHGIRTIFPFYMQNSSVTKRPLENVQFYSRPRKAKILTTPVRSAGPTGQAGIHRVFRGLKVEPDAGIYQKGAFPKGLINGYVELPYTLPQDFTLFILMKEKTIDIWKQKLDWIAQHGGMALLNTHSDYMNFNHDMLGLEEYPVTYYTEFIEYIKNRYKDQYWHVLPKQMAHFWQQNYSRS